MRTFKNPLYVDVPMKVVFDQRPGPKPGSVGELAGMNTTASGYITIEPQMTGFSWTLRNELRDIRWQGLIHLIGERYIEELTDLEDALCEYRNFQIRLPPGKNSDSSTPR